MQFVNLKSKFYSFHLTQNQQKYISISALKIYCSQIVILWVRAPLKDFFFLKYDLKRAFSDILIHFQWSNLILSGARTHESTLFLGRNRKIFCWFLLQVKSVQFAFEIEALSIWTYKKTWSSRCNFFKKCQKNYKCWINCILKKNYNDWISQHLWFFLEMKKFWFQKKLQLWDQSIT